MVVGPAGEVWIVLGSPRWGLIVILFDPILAVVAVL
jgi:hypothetical protein